MNASTATPQTDAEQAAELRRMFADNTTKLGIMAAALGLTGQESPDKIAEHCRRHVEAHTKLLGAANEVLVSTQNGLDGCWVRPAAVERLRDSVAFTQGL